MKQSTRFTIERCLYRPVRLTSAVILFAALVAISGSETQAASRDTIADRVLGQTGFTTAASGSGLANLYSPRGLAVDTITGRIYVADSSNNRVLGWPSATAFAKGNAATIAITTADGAADTLNAPSAVAVDRSGNLYVADSFKDRILKFNAPVSSSSVAARVIGQSSAIGLPTVDTMQTPYGVAVDASGNLFVADTYFNRVLEFNAPLTTGMPASRVFGQPDFTSGGNNQNKPSPGADTLYWPFGIAIDNTGNLFVSDTNNSRVLIYSRALSSDAIADLVIGQPNFSSNTGGVSATLLSHPTGLAVDTCGGLYVADGNNNRVVKYNPTLKSAMSGAVHFGQVNFSQNTLSIPPTASSLNNPRGVAVDSAQNVYVADTTNHRVLGYDAPSPSSCDLYLPMVKR